MKKKADLNRKKCNEKMAYVEDKTDYPVLRCVIPVVCRINQTVMCMHISQTQLYIRWYANSPHANHNHMLRRQSPAIISLYK